MRRFLRVFKNTTFRLIRFAFYLLIIASFFVYKDFYRAQWHKTLSFYYVYLGDNYYKKRRPQEAITSYIKALKLYPKHYRAQYNLGNLYVVYEDYYSALEAYQKALELKPDFTVARIDYAIVLSQATFNYDKAIEEYDLAVAKIPKWVYIPFIVDNKHSYKHNKGVAYYNQGLAWRGKSIVNGDDIFLSRKYLERAVQSYEKALTTLKIYDVYYNLAIAHHLLRNYDAAGYYYCKAIDKEPMKYEAHYNLAILLKVMKMYPYSIEEFKKAGLLLDADGNTNRTRYVYDVLSQVSQKYSKSEEYLELKERAENGEEGLLGVFGEEEDEKIEYANGKILLTNEFDGAVFKNFKTCANKKYFDEGLKD